MKAGPDEPTRVTDVLLRAWALPQPGADDDKDERGRTLVIAGSREMPGAAVLAGTAALRAGAGKLVVATGAAAAAAVALALPEARVVALPETPAGGLPAGSLTLLDDVLRRVDAVLVGPGLVDEAPTCGFVAALLRRCSAVPVVLDALAMGAVGELGRFAQPVALTPHAGEMAHLTGTPKEAIEREAGDAAGDAARRWNAVVALKGAATHVAAADGRHWLHEGGNAGLATSGSGDTLAGIVVGLAARGAALEQACVWGVALHAAAGNALAARLGPLGYLARELPAEIPRLMQALAHG